MAELAITVTYIMRITPEWYDPQVLSGLGTLEEQICEYEMERVLKYGLYVADLKIESVGVNFVPELPVAHCGDEKKHSKHNHFIGDNKFNCTGNPIVTLDEVLQPEPDEDIETPGMPNRCQPIGCDAGIHLPGCPYAEIDKEDEDRTESYPDVEDDRHSDE